MRSVTVIIGQNIMDIAMQEYGDADAIVEVCELNELEIDDDIYPGQVLNLRDLTDDDEVANYYKSKGIEVSSTLSMVPVPILSTGADQPITTNNDNLTGI
jgi:hypothetical protein